MTAEMVRTRAAFQVCRVDTADGMEHSTAPGRMETGGVHPLLSTARGTGTSTIAVSMFTAAATTRPAFPFVASWMLNERNEVPFLEGPKARLQLPLVEGLIDNSYDFFDQILVRTRFTNTAAMGLKMTG